VSGNNSSPSSSELDYLGNYLPGIDFCALQEFCGGADIDSVIESAEVDGESPTSYARPSSTLYAQFGALSGMRSCDEFLPPFV